MHKVGEYLSEFLRRKIGACRQLSADFATYCENESLYKCLGVQIHHVHCTDGLLVANVSAIRPSRTLTCTGINRNADLSACHSLRMHMDVYLYMRAKGGESHRLHGCVIECQAWQFKMPSITKL